MKREAELLKLPEGALRLESDDMTVVVKYGEMGNVVVQGKNKETGEVFCDEVMGVLLRKKPRVKGKDAERFKEKTKKNTERIRKLKEDDKKRG